ncbi:MAG: putative Holliday junction resolvase, partial [Cognaticolwellia sp.]
MASKAAIGERTILGFDFGKKYIGVAVGQEITG